MGRGSDGSHGTSGSSDEDDGLLTRLEDVATMAFHGVPGCDAAAVSVAVEDDVVTIGATSDAAYDLDAVQCTAGDGPCLRALREGVVVRVDDYTTDPRWPVVTRAAGQWDVRSTLSVPLQRGQRRLGALNMHAHRAAAFDRWSTQVADVLARQAAGIVHDVELRRRSSAMLVAEQRIASALQQALLPAVPVLEGISTASRYVAAERSAEIGGDWYDLFPLPEGRIGFAVGDVMGHNLTAAAAMGQLRSALRSHAYETTSPAEVLDRLDRFVQGFGLALATAVYGTLVLQPGGARMLLCNAGHPPPLLRSASGEVRRLDEGASWLIGVSEGRLGPRSDAAVRLDPGSTLVLYTDGLVERRRSHLDRGIDLLCRALSALPAGSGPEQVCDELIDAVVQDGSVDDLALLVVQVR